MIFCVVGFVCRRVSPDRCTAVPGRLFRAITAVWLDTEGNALVEYALVMSLLSAVMLGGMTAIGTAAASALTTAESEVLNYGLRNGL